jgi:hypothetical protein
MSGWGYDESSTTILLDGHIDSVMVLSPVLVRAPLLAAQPSNAASIGALAQQRRWLGMIIALLALSGFGCMMHAVFISPLLAGREATSSATATSISGLRASPAASGPVSRGVPREEARIPPRDEALLL